MVKSKTVLSAGQAGTIATALLLLGCTASGPEPNQSNHPKVVATSSILCDLTQQIAAQTIELTCLVKPGVDPHAYALTPSDRKSLETAQLILYNGYGLQPSVEKTIQATSANITKIAVAEQAVPNPLRSTGHHHDDDADKEHGQKGNENNALETNDEEKDPDPHVWHNPKQGIQMVTVLKRSLTQLAPEQANIYAQTSKQITTELEQIDTWIKAQIQTIPEVQRQLVTTHDALAYFATTYGLTVEGALQGLSTEEKPSAARIKELVADIKAAQVPTIFVESGDASKLMQTVAQEAGVKVAQQDLFTDSLGEASSRGNTYQTMLIANTETLVKGLGGQYIPFTTAHSSQQ